MIDDDELTNTALMQMPIGDASTVQLSKAAQKKASEKSAVPFEEGGSAPPKLTKAERRALEAENFTGTLALSPDAPPKQEPAPKADPVYVLDAPDKTEALMGVQRSNQDSRTVARVLAELATSEDAELKRFLDRRVESDLDMASLAYMRDILGALSLLTKSTEPDDAKAIKRAWEGLYPILKRRF